jgi:hypothetical protein
MRRPLSVVGTDQEALRALISLHACPEPRILDVTHNRGRMWKGLPYTPHRSDRDPCLHEQGFTDTIADFRNLPFPDASFDVIVFDPPHLTDGTTGIHGDGGYGQRYGVTGIDYQHEPNVTFTFDAFLAEARRILVPRVGVVLAKIADQIHGAEYQWQARTLQNKAETAGFACCDLILSVRWSRGSLIDPRWARVCHARQVHCYWLVLRNGPDCISPTAPRADVKPRTAEMFA